MKKSEPVRVPAEAGMARLAELTRRIVAVPRHELEDAKKRAEAARKKPKPAT
jgi:hypothetical protein